MSKMFPIFLDLENKRIHIYGAGRIASRRVKTLQLFGPRMIVHAPEASCQIQKAADEGVLMLRRECYQPGSIPADVFFVLAATDDCEVNEQIYRECREKGILVNVCSNRGHCDFHFPGIVSRGDLVVGVNAGGTDHSLAKKWTDRIRKEVEKDGYDNQAEKASDHSRSSEDGAGDKDG